MINLTEEDGPLMELPDEIWEKILNLKRMTAQDIANFRSVNKKCNSLADNFFNRWILKLDDRYEHDEQRGPYLETLLDLRVKWVRVYHLLEQLPFRPQGVVFKFPDLLKCIKVYSKDVSDVSISAKNLHVLLKSRNLEALSLSLVDKNVNSLVYSSQPPLIGYDFSKLQKLYLDFCHGKKPLELIQGNLLDRILKGSIYENLHTVDFVVQMDTSLATAYQISCDMLEFIVKYGHILTTVEFVTYLPEYSPAGFPHSLDSINEYRLNNCSSLTNLIVGSDFLHDTWRALVKVQTKLTELVVVEISIPVILLRTVVDKNYRTLNSIKIRDLDVDTAMVDRHFDFSIFSNCHNLTSLELSYDNSAEGRNLFAIHQNLKELELDYLLSSADLLLFSSSHMELKKLVLSDAGTLGDFGVNGSVLETLLALIKLTDIDIDSSSINLSNPVETVKLESILGTLGISFHSDVGENIYLKRDPSTNLWSKNLCSRT